MTTESPFAAACRNPFSNGTEGEAWEDKWCAYCARDHDIHAEYCETGKTDHESHEGGYGCGLLLAAMGDEWPEGWIPEPDDGKFFLPSRLVCTAFVPCEDCGGDPGAEARAERVSEVTAYWRNRREGVA